VTAGSGWRIKAVGKRGVCKRLSSVYRRVSSVFRRTSPGWNRPGAEWIVLYSCRIEGLNP